MLNEAPLPFGLAPIQLERYARHLILPEVGGRGQRALLDATVAVHGTGRAAEEAVIYLAAAGVGEIRVSPAADASLKARVADLNPDVTLRGRGAGDPPGTLELPGERRLDGALAALRHLCDAVGVCEAGAWTIDLPALGPAAPCPPAPPEEPS